MLNNLQSYQIIFSVALGFYLGSLLAQIANTFLLQPEPAKFDYSYLKIVLFRNIIWGLVGGFVALAIGSVDVGYLESFSVTTIFFFAFLWNLLTAGADTLLRVIKLIFLKIMPSKNTN